MPENIATMVVEVGDENHHDNWSHVEFASLFIDDHDVSKASLVLFEYYYNYNKDNYGSRLFCCDVWVVNKYDHNHSQDYSWNKLEFTINLDKRFKALGFLSEFIILVISSNKPILFDIRSQQYNCCLQIDGGDDISIRSHVGTYMENFLTLNDISNH
uniref:Uncharacterized protein n=1 Tax=Cannabis sativa TaxID=3483 RepID=A0A803PW97_CANSA